MKKTTTTLLTVAGLLALAGCKSEVMNDTYYKAPPAQEDPQSTAIPRYRQPAENAVPAAPRQNTRVMYQPMTPVQDEVAGIDEKTVKKPAKRTVKSSKKVAAGSVYIVKPGDTLGRIARRHGVKVADLRNANGLDPKKDRALQVGAKLTIPGGKAVARRSAAAVKSAAKKGGARRTPKLNADGTYTMVKGDTIPGVARKFGIRAKVLQKANNLSDEDTRRLQIGTKLVIPGKASAAPAPVAPAAKPVVPPPAAETAAPEAPAPAVPAAAAAAAPAAPAAPAAAPAADKPVISTAAPQEEAVTATKFVPVGNAKTVEEFAAQNNITVKQVRELNPSLGDSNDLGGAELLFIPADK